MLGSPVAEGVATGTMFGLGGQGVQDYARGGVSGAGDYMQSGVLGGVLGGGMGWLAGKGRGRKGASKQEAKGSAGKGGRQAKKAKPTTPEHRQHLKADGTLKGAEAAKIDPTQGEGLRARFEKRRWPTQGTGDQIGSRLRRTASRGAASPDRKRCSRSRRQFKVRFRSTSQFTVDMPVKGPAGSGTLRTGWIYDADSTVPRLVTLFLK